MTTVLSLVSALDQYGSLPNVLQAKLRNFYRDTRTPANRLYLGYDEVTAMRKDHAEWLHFDGAGTECCCGLPLIRVNATNHIGVGVC